MKVKWSSLAKEQLHETLRFYRKRNGSSHYGNRLKSQIRKIIGHIKTHNFYGEYLEQEKLRRVCIENFELLYDIKETHVEILSFRDARRQPEDLRCNQ